MAGTWRTYVGYVDSWSESCDSFVSQFAANFSLAANTEISCASSKVVS